ncbi:hypothetical protein ACI2UK_13785 [Ralstonia nicotianae]|uniref:hypothetical protein n=1 Tax=Ralstonia pseudosolanacearum TaxID=1310165 RepID=UPI002003BDA8|nr:hypothetical protein [Ralstonia pseudosolanacearum]MCK4118386.1 hypothetical protein [Ralstonia pseudosolanacearum]
MTSKLSSLTFSLTTAFAMAACGGGGDANSTTASSTGSTGTTSAAQVPLDPYTGAQATGTPTASVSGSVVNGPTAGATVTAYMVNANGSNGTPLGSTTTDASGAFSMTLDQPPTGMVRFVATGGAFTSEADNSQQKNVALQLVAPYVTTSLSNFVITPVTHLASTQLTYLASTGGKSLTAAYTAASSAALQLLTGNNVIASANRSHGGVDFLGIAPGSAQDTLNTYADALTAIEYYAVQHDLPSHVAVRVLYQSSVTGVPQQVGADGQAINVGAWVGSTFDESQPVTVAQMSNAQPANDVLAIVLAMNAIQACTSGNHSGFYQRYPLSAGQADYLDSTGCAAYAANMNAVKTKITTNNRNKYVS